MSFGKGKDESTSSGTAVSAVSSQSGSKRGVEAFLGQGSKVVGNLTFSGPVELDGYVEGEVHSKGRLEIGEAAKVNGKIIGTEIFVRGTITGDIVASERLSLMKPAKVIGNITSSNLSIEEGVIFEGTCTMERAAASAQSSSASGPKKVSASA